MKASSFSVITLLVLWALSADAGPPEPAQLKQIEPGIEYLFYDKVTPRIHAIILNRSYKKYELRVLADKDPADGTFRSHGVEHFARTHSPRALVAINGGAWRCPKMVTLKENPWEWARCQGAGLEGRPIPTGIVVTNGTPHGTPQEGELILGTSRASHPGNHISIIPKAEWPTSEAYHYYALGINALKSELPQYVMKSGECQNTIEARDTRSAIGYGPEVVVLLSTEHGPDGIANARDLCAFFKPLGVTDAMFLDGGHATQMYVKDRIVNPPWHKFEARVANAIGIVQCQGGGDSCGSSEECCGGLTCNAGVCRAPAPMCTPSWSCTAYSACANGVRTRTCTDLNMCGTTAGKPPETMSCLPRTNIRRLHGSNGLGCQNPSADWDHCHTVNGMTCLAGQSAALSYASESPPSHEQFWVTSLAAAPGSPDTAMIDGVLMSRLDACYHSGGTMHVLEPQDKLKADAIQSSSSQGINGWTCERVGYVKTGSIIPGDPNQIPTYRIKIPNKSSAFIAPSNTPSDPSCDVQNTGVAWFGWKTP